MSHAPNEIEDQLRQVVRKFVDTKNAIGADRAAFDLPGGQLPAFWSTLADLGVLGLHVPEELGGGGADWAHLAVVLEELGAVAAPGPFISIVVVADLLARRADPAVAQRFVPGLVGGESTAGLGLSGTELARSAGRLNGTVDVVLGGSNAAVFVVCQGSDALIVDAANAGIESEPLRGVDPGLDLAKVTFDDVELPASAVIEGGAAHALALLRLAAAAHATGGSRSTLDGAFEYAKTRKQFGKPIGSFQAVKHHCADMLIESETGAALVWDATRQIDAGERGDLVRAAAAAAAVAVPAFVFTARKAIQIYGGIGFSWEHDAHLLYRRAIALAALIQPESAAAELADLWSPDFRDDRHPALPESVESQRDEIRVAVEKIAALDVSEHRRELVHAGLAMPQLQRPWGVEASPALQLLIRQEMDRAEVHTPVFGITGWCAGSIIQFGTPEQVERFAEPALLGDEIWCQLFSEPDAGSDAAAIKARGLRTEGGWIVTGQKVWTSFAHESSFGLATVRTDPSASKHGGITAMIIDMAAPGVSIRPLRQITDKSDFNEVWLEEVFVPDSHVVGQLGDGWRVARTTFENERMSLGRGATDGQDTEDEIVGMLASNTDRASFSPRVGRFLARRHAARMINLRWAERAVTLAPPGAEGNITKMLRAESLEEIGQIELAMLGPRAATGAFDTVSGAAGFRLLDSPRASIAGGTSEIVRTQIAERIIGLPRERHT